MGADIMQWAETASLGQEDLVGLMKTMSRQSSGLRSLLRTVSQLPALMDADVTPENWATKFDNQSSMRRSSDVFERFTDDLQAELASHCFYLDTILSRHSNLCGESSLH